MTDKLTPEQQEAIRQVRHAQAALDAELELLLLEIPPRPCIAALIHAALRIAREHDIPPCRINMMWTMAMALSLELPEMHGGDR